MTRRWLHPSTFLPNMVVKQIKMAVEIYSHLPRYRQIFQVFFKHGFADVLKMVHLQKLLEISQAQLFVDHKEMLNKRPAERFRMALEELGPTFVKLGQILSSRRDLVNEEFYNELRKLQNSVAPFPGADAKRIVEEELGKPLDQVFKEFDETPIASASMAQVHRAVLRGGDIVAVKVQRPDISKNIEVDLAILADVARFLDRHVEELAALNPVGVVREFARTLMQELDFSHEAQNMDRFAKQFHGNRGIHVPHLYHEITTQRVLAMEFMSGYQVDNPEELRAHRIDPVKYSEKMSKLVFQQIFQFGFFHGDPHPGNVTVLPGGVMGLYDYGMMGSLTADFREDIAGMIMGLVDKDERQVTRSVLGMSEQGFVEDQRKLGADVEAFAQQHLDKPLKDLKLGFVLNRLLDLLMTHKLRMKAEFYLGIKALTQVEAIGQALNPDLNFAHFGEPYATEVIKGKYDPMRMLKGLYKAMADGFDFLKDFPEDFRDVYNRVKSGNYTIPVEHRINPDGFEPLRKTMNHIANRLVDAILAASVLICSGLLVLSKVPPVWNGIPVLGILGLVLGLMMGLRLFISIWKHGGL